MVPCLLLDEAEGEGEGEAEAEGCAAIHCRHSGSCCGSVKDSGTRPPQSGPYAWDRGHRGLYDRDASCD